MSDHALDHSNDHLLCRTLRQDTQNVAYAMPIKLGLVSLQNLINPVDQIETLLNLPARRTEWIKNLNLFWRVLSCASSTSN